MRSYKIKVHPRVNGQLERHSEFIARVSRSAAVQFRSEFKKVMIRLAENPYQFPPYDLPDLPDGPYRKALFGKWYKAIFYVEEDTVYLDAVIDGRQEISADELE